MINCAIIFAALFFECSHDNTNDQAEVPVPAKAATPAAKQEGLNQHLLGSVIWYQHSGEMAALYYQAYNLAALRLDQKLAERKNRPAKNKKSKTAVVVDVDETVLNNSPFETELIKKNITTKKDFDIAWDSWVMFAKAKALPGALEFLQYAKSKGVDVFYVSNRNEGWQKQATLENLANLNFPNTADTTFMLFKVKESGKETRRAFISNTHDILLLCGDNLADLSADFDGRDKDEKMDKVKVHGRDFGNSFIIMPNPMYGDWEKYIFSTVTNPTPVQKDSLRHVLLLPR